ncbi:DUF6812 domain-containing protein [Cysteiniphilum halobium]|uniref:DUF6812 domain-containing protein n=1 Tax=Cysteiniphilum halobium TaxID=2219059 RepID=UPI000E65A01B|nr:hypothetical protein [Cysteiniphilum halobium]
MPFYYNAADSKNSARDFIAVTIYTNKYIVKGEISVRVGVRLTDHINSETSGKFIALRNVKIHMDINAQAISECAFMNINLDNILFVHPDP